MDDPNQPSRAYADLGPIQRSTSSEPPRPPLPPKPSARTGKIIGELGLRYRPTAALDLEAHAAALALLIRDLADIPSERLERAVNAWVRAERWMPKAADLAGIVMRHMADDAAGRPTFRSQAEQAAAFCEARNAALAADPSPTARKDIEWYVDGAGEAKLRYKRDDPPAHVERVALDQVDRLNRGLRRFNAPFRYARDGWPFDLAPGEADPTDPSQAAAA